MASLVLPLCQVLPYLLHAPRRETPPFLARCAFSKDLVPPTPLHGGNSTAWKTREFVLPDGVCFIVLLRASYGVMGALGRLFLVSSVRAWLMAGDRDNR